MCGIAGVISFQEAARDSSVIERMTQSLAHRGPDDASFYNDDCLALGFRRLSIVGVENGRQPIWNEDRSVLIAVNGEIYNHLELKDGLKNSHQFSTDSDSEVVLHLYEEQGVEAFKKLNGMFAIVIWDLNKKQLIIARDRLGIKPLYYALSNQKLMFASELKALLIHPDCPNSVNWSDLEILNLQQQSTVSTFVDGVHHLDGGSYAVYDQHQGLQIAKYWDISDHLARENVKKQADYCREYGELLEDAVEKRLMSEVPVGIFLSGGIDSSLITALAAKKTQQLHCFTVVERTTYRAGDVERARKIADQYGVPFYPILFDPMEIANKFNLADLEKMICLIESPRFDPEWLFKSELHRAAKHCVPDLKVILLGQGADEFAGGYSNSVGSNNSNWEAYINNDVIHSIDYFRRYEKSVPSRLSDAIAISSDSEKKGPYHEKMKLHTYQLQYFNLWHEDRTSSYHGVESRVPFLDHRLVELLASTPADYHADLFWDKRIIRDMLHKTIENFPKDTRKVPFFVTDDIASIDEFACAICMNVFTEFKNQYLCNNQESIIKAGACQQLFESVKKRRYNAYDSAWRLIELMSIAIFHRFLKTPEALLNSSQFGEKKQALPLVGDNEWQGLEQEYNGSPQLNNTKQCAPVDRISIAAGCEVLNPLTENEGSTCLILSYDGNQVRRIAIPDHYYWVVQVIDEMGGCVDAPKDAAYWMQASNAPENEFYGMMNQLMVGGFLEKVGE